MIVYAAKDPKKKKKKSITYLKAIEYFQNKNDVAWELEEKNYQLKKTKSKQKKCIHCMDKNDNA